MPAEGGYLEDCLTCSVARHERPMKSEHVLVWARRTMRQQREGFTVVRVARAVQKPWPGVLEVLRRLAAQGLLERREVTLESGEVVVRWFAVPVDEDGA